MTEKLQELAQKLTVANAGATALVSGFSHDGRQLPGAERILENSLAAAVEAGDLAKRLLEAKTKANL